MAKFKKAQVLIGLGVLTALTGLSTMANAGGFQLYEQNVTNQGNAYAGTGAQADDASIEFYNPAGMVRIKNPQVVVSGVLINPDAHVNVTSSTSTTIAYIPPYTGIPILVEGPGNVGGATNLSPAKSAIVPAFHFVYPFAIEGHAAAIGIGANAPFGLETDYDSDSSVRYLATQSALQVLDISPGFAIAVTPQFSVGLGLDPEYMSATFNQGLPENSADPNSIGGYLTNKTDSWGWGWHGGLMYQPTEMTRFGLSYHSEVHQKLTGTSLVDLVLNLSAINPALSSVNLGEPGYITANVTLPDYIDFSAYHDINCEWAVLGSVDYTRWSVIQTVNATFSGPMSNGDLIAIPNAQLPFNFRDTWRVAGGVNYRPWQPLTLRTGLGWDETPVKNDQTRTFRLPDSDRIVVALGAQYIVNKMFTVDAGYTHLFFNNTHIGNTQVFTGAFSTPTSPAVVIPFAQTESGQANVKGGVNEYGLQLTWNIV